MEEAKGEMLSWGAGFIQFGMDNSKEWGNNKNK